MLGILLCCKLALALGHNHDLKAGLVRGLYLQALVKASADAAKLGCAAVWGQPHMEQVAAAHIEEG